MGTYEMNVLFALVIGALVSLSLSNFFRRGGPWTKRSRLFAMVRLRTNRWLRKKNGVMRFDATEGAPAITTSLLFWVLVVALLVTITITMLQNL